MRKIEETIFSNDFLAFGKDENGIPLVDMKKKGIVNFVIDQNQNIYLIKRSRGKQTSLEVPRGFADTVEAVKVFKSKFLDNGVSITERFDLGVVEADNGIMNNAVTITGVIVYIPEGFQDDELMVVQAEDLFPLIAQGVITCGYSLSAISRYVAHRMTLNQY